MINPFKRTPTVDERRWNKIATALAKAQATEDFLVAWWEVQGVGTGYLIDNRGGLLRIGAPNSGATTLDELRQSHKEGPRRDFAKVSGNLTLGQEWGERGNGALPEGLDKMVEEARAWAKGAMGTTQLLQTLAEHASRPRLRIF